MKMKHSITVLALFVTVFAASLAAQDMKKNEVKTVDAVDLKQYSGKWYEIARYPNKFQKKCVGNTTATYTLEPKNRVEVLNECVKKDGVTDKAEGEAKVVEGSNNSKLKVRFAPSFLSFIPAVWGDYWILELGPNYSYSVVGDPNRDYFWILSREPEMSDALYQQILRRAETMGFDPAKVQKTPQKVEVIKGSTIVK
jgi:apolipoprotein D and lipocalin family protein